MTRSGSQDLDYDLDGGGDEGGHIGPSPVDWALLVLRAPRRRKLLFAAVLVTVVALVVTYYRLATPIYRVEAKILAQQQQVIPAAMRVGPEDNPARTAWEVIHRRDNVLSIIKSAKLLGEPPAPSWRDWLFKPRDPLDRLVYLLDKRLLVTTEEGTISISLDWTDPQQAYAIVDGSIQNFIETRHVQEVTAIDEVLSVLRVRAANAKDQLDRVTDEVRREAAGAAPREPHLASAAPAPRGASDELIRLKSLLDSKERAVQDVEEFRRRRLADLHAQLSEQLATFSEAHPSVIQLRQDIDALSKESPQVTALQAEATKLRADYQARYAQESGSIGGGSPALGGFRAPPRMRSPETPIEDDERVRDARTQYQQIVERVNGAQLELDAVRAAFKYRYHVVWPPRIPQDPISPNPIKIFGAGFLVALALAFVAAAIPDLSSGRIVERWQLERGLGITVLAEIEKKK